MIDQRRALKNSLEAFDPRIDRVPHKPVANRGWTVERLVAERQDLLEAEAGRAGRGYKPGPGLNQGREGQCVLYMCAHRRNSMNKRLKPPVEDRAQLSSWYHDVQHEDPWDGCDWGRQCPRAPGPDYGGTSVHSAMEYGRRQGWWNSYWWVGAGSGDVLGDIVKANHAVGPISYGLPWLESMFEPRPSGLLEVDRSSRVVGGHALHSPGVRLKMRLRTEWKGTKEVAVMQQSWGELEHGVADMGRPGGMVYIKLDDLDWLMNTQAWGGGEGAVTVR